MAVLPTRDQIENVLQEHTGQGREAMRQALDVYCGDFPDLGEDGKQRILNDLESYLPYAQEE